MKLSSTLFLSTLASCFAFSNVAALRHKHAVASFGPADGPRSSLLQEDSLLRHQIGGVNPVLMASTSAFGTRDERSPLEVGKDILNARFGGPDGYVITGMTETRKSKITVLHGHQKVNGLPIANNEFILPINQQNQIIASASQAHIWEPYQQSADQARRRYIQASTSSMVPEMDSHVIEPIDAVLKFVNHKKIEGVQASALELEDTHQGHHAFSALDESAGEAQSGLHYLVQNAHWTVPGHVKVTKEYLRVDDAVRLTWCVNMEMEENWFHGHVDAHSGEVLQDLDWVADASYHVYPFGVNDPSEGDAKDVVDPQDTEHGSPLGWHDDGKKKYTDTRGNNVWAQENPTGGYEYATNKRPNGGKMLIFNATYDIATEPSSSIDNAVTQLFYMNNVIHDVFYRYGFNEKNGNFQTNNFKKGGRGGDAVIANAQDGSGTNNANFATPPDGQHGKMRMYIWTQTEPGRDGDLEEGIVVHEYGHGISTRLTGGPANSNCLGYGESGGMGEGWGDMWATMFRMKGTETRETDFTMGEWSASRGIRPFPYSTNMTTNPHTYAYLRKPSYYGVHATGAVWASMLYEVYWNLVDKHGFNGDWYSPDNGAGNTKFLQLLVDGLMLQPCRPKFTDARDAILQADMEGFNGEDQCLIWKGFAKRGLGVKAKSSRNDFSVPAECAEEKDEPKEDEPETPILFRNEL